MGERPARWAFRGRAKGVGRDWDGAAALVAAAAAGPEIVATGDAEAGLDAGLVEEDTEVRDDAEEGGQQAEDDDAHNDEEQEGEQLAQAVREPAEGVGKAERVGEHNMACSTWNTDLCRIARDVRRAGSNYSVRTPRRERSSSN